jgi:hypothetical protein
MNTSSGLYYSSKIKLQKSICKTGLLIIFLISSCFASAQDKQSEMSEHKWKIKVMKEQITILKNGALLVRLKTKENSVNALNEIGDSISANRIIENQRSLNKKIISAFRKNYTFSPVFFFYSNFSDTVRNHKLNEVVFLNDELIPDTNINPGTLQFLTSELGNLSQDTAAYISGSYLAHTDEGLKRNESYYGGTDTKIKALVIMSDQFIQLSDPFPYYSKVANADPSQKRLDKAILRMNKNLNDYYKESSR